MVVCTCMYDLEDLNSISVLAVVSIGMFLFFLSESVTLSGVTWVLSAVLPGI